MRQGVRAEKQEQRLLHEGVQEQAERNNEMKSNEDTLKDEEYEKIRTELMSDSAYAIKVKYHEGASKLGSDVHGVMCDMAASETVEMKKGECKVIPLGVSMKLQEGCWGLLVPRSSTCLKHGIMMANSIGIIEPDYCGDDDVWGFVAYAIRDTVIEQGTRIAQFMPIPLMVRWDSIRFKELDSMPYPNRGGYGSTGEKAGRHVLDRNGNPIYAGSYVHMAYSNETKRVAHVFAEGESLELENGTVINERNSGKSEKILYQNGGWDRATSVYVVNGTMDDALGAISCLERENKRLKVENAALKAEIERLKRKVPDDCMSFPLDADGAPIRLGDEVLYVGINAEITKDDPLKVAGLVPVLDMDETYIVTREYPDKAIAPKLLTHKQPEQPDSWEKLLGDLDRATNCEISACCYASNAEKPCKSCKFNRWSNCVGHIFADIADRIRTLMEER